MADLIADRFRLIDLLGTGGSASVFLAEDATTGQRVALKILHPHLTERAAAREHFLAEAARSARFRHPHAVQVLDVGEDRDRPEPVVWIALEFVSGATLAEHVRATGPLSPEAAISVMIPVLDALDAAHTAGLVHRDVSPTNVMVARGSNGVLDPSTVRLLDFGIAGDVGETALGSAALLAARDEGGVGVLGNASYVSPEQARGDAVDERGDIYQAGALLYFALVGHAPFQRDDPTHVARAHVEAPPPVPSVGRPGIPRSLDRVVVKAMLKDPADRFPTARAMCDALVAVATEATGATTPTAARSALRPASSAEPATANHEDRTGVTRVLGTTATPPRASSPAVSPFAAVHRRRRPAGIAMFATVAAAVTLGVVISLATSPSASVTTEPTPEPLTSTPTPEPTSPTTAADTRPRVPDVAQLRLAEASEQIVAAGFVVGAVTSVDSRWTEGTVIETSPASGDRAAFGSTVAVTVASGYNSVPTVIGLDVHAALESVAAAGFTAGSAPTSTVGPGVIRTDPVGGTRRVVGSTVTVFEPAPPPSPTPTPTALPTPPPTPTAVPTPTVSP
ncbi:PASTA domain-containing protein [Microbacterium sp.]|uniref:protein kinase domain-containing protein n=1 Tax=Microbacterium sp. TaxID=51671 RepID=UPI002623A699|nr:PASTA domain-containing protein [Microbacterium sp.]